MRSCRDFARLWLAARGGFAACGRDFARFPLAARGFAACALLLLAGTGYGAQEELDSCARRAVDAVQKRYESVVDLRARFDQVSRSVALGGPGAETHSAGEVVFAKPGKMRWSYSEPEPSLVVSDGSWLWIYDPGAREAQKLPVIGGRCPGPRCSSCWARPRSSESSGWCRGPAARRRPS